MVEVRHREPCIKNQGVGGGWHWVEWSCCYGRRNLGDFSNRGCKCLSKVILYALVIGLHRIGMLNSLESRLALSTNIALNATTLTKSPNLKH